MDYEVIYWKYTQNKEQKALKSRKIMVTSLEIRDGALIIYNTLNEAEWILPTGVWLSVEKV